MFKIFIIEKTCFLLKNIILIPFFIIIFLYFQLFFQLYCQTKNVVDPSLILEPNNFVIKIEVETSLIAKFPFVNAIFFERNSSKLPNYLLLETLTKNEYFNKNIIDKNKYIFSYIKNILIDNPNTEIVLEGSSSGENIEENAENLPYLRAKTVKDAIVKLGIDSSKVSIRENNAKKIYSNNNYIEGQEENQRVNIYFNNIKVVSNYIRTIDFAKLFCEKEYKVRILNTNREGVLYSWLADSSIIVQPNIEFKTYKFYINAILDNSKFINGVLDSVLIDETILSLGSNDISFVDTINLKNVKQKVIKTNYNNFKQIILFDYNCYKLSEKAKMDIYQLLDEIPANCRLKIYGTTDNIGSKQYNKLLALNRAKEIRNYINSLKNDLVIEVGINDNDKFPNSTQYGRFLNRNAIINIVL